MKINNNNNNKEVPNIITAPPSKSYEQRVLACSLLSNGNCNIYNFGKSDDVIAARSIIKTLGAKPVIEGEFLEISPGKISSSKILDCNESALCARLFAPIACIFKNEFTITGHGTLLSRKIAENFLILEQMGSVISHHDYKVPVVFKKARIKGGEFTIDGSKTSQFVSGLSLALPNCNKASTIIVKHPSSINYILLSIEIAKKFGVNIFYDINATRSELTLNIPDSQKYTAGNFEVEGDWSGSACIMVAAAIYGKASISRLNPNSIQPDNNILEVFALSNVKYYWEGEIIHVEKSDLCSFEFNAKDCPDLIPVLIILAVFANGKSRIYGTSRLINKESSRGEVMQKELAKLGIKINLGNDYVEIAGKQKFKINILDSHNDHRIAMALSIISLKFPDGLKIENMKSINKSYPDFLEDLNKIIIY